MTDSSQTEAFWRSHNDGLYRMPRAWVHQGTLLMYSFEAIAKASNPDSLTGNIDSPALMLAGMSLENYLKAIILHRHREQSLSGVPAGFMIHDLVNLALSAKVTFSPEQIATAKALTQYITWRGRYVAPIDNHFRDHIPVALDISLVGGARITKGGAHLNATIPLARNLIEYVVGEVKLRIYDNKESDKWWVFG